MLPYLSNLVKSFEKYSQSFDDQIRLIDQPWLLKGTENSRCLYIFRKNNELIVTSNGNVEKLYWELISGSNAVLIESGDRKELYKLVFLDQKVFILQKEDREEYLFLVNENEFNGTLEEFINNKEDKNLGEDSGKTIYRNGRENDTDYGMIKFYLLILLLIGVLGLAIHKLLS